MPDFGGLALSHLGTLEAAADLRGLVDVVARAAATERRERSGKARAQALSEASRSARRLGRQLSRLDEATLLRVLGETATAAREAGGLSVLDGYPGEPMHRRVAMMRNLPALAGHLAGRLAAAAAAVPVTGAGRPARSDALSWALESLRLLWVRHERGDPTQGRTRGRFGALAEATFVGPPCGFGEGPVRHAVAALLPAPVRSRQRLVHVNPARDASGKRVVIIGADTPLGRELANQYRERTPHLVGCAWQPRPPAEARMRPWDTTVADLATAGKLPQIDGKPIEIAIVVPTSPEDAADDAGLIETLAVAPHRALTDLLRRTGEAAPRRIVLLAPVVPLARLDPRRRFRRAARLALGSLVASEAAVLRDRGTIVTGIVPAWGADRDMEPLRVTPDMAAWLLTNTVAGLTASHAGKLLDLHGGELPF